MQINKFIKKTNLKDRKTRRTPTIWKTFTNIPIQVPLSQTLDVEVLKKKINQLIAKLKRKHVHLHVFDHTDIHYGPMLGKGSEGVVQRCRVCYNDFHIDAAIKTVLNSTEDNLDVTLHEIELLCLAHDPIMSTVIKVYGVASVPMMDDPTRGHLVIVTEVGLKNLLQLYQDEVMQLHVTLRLWHDLCIAIHLMHRKNIIHQDLKPENVLVTSLTRDSNGGVFKVEMKIIDLGMSVVVDKVKGCIETDDVTGTLGYHAPEVLLDSCHDFSADVFALAIVFCVMLLPRSTLQTHDSLQAFLKKVHTSKKEGLCGPSLYYTIIHPHLDHHHSLPTSLTTLICQMLERAEEREDKLLLIANTCNAEALSLSKQCPHPPPPCLSHSSDSGFMSDKRKFFLRRKRLFSDDDDDDDDDDDGEDDDDNDDDDDGGKRSHDNYRHFKNVFNQDEDEKMGNTISKLAFKSNGHFQSKKSTTIIVKKKSEVDKKMNKDDKVEIRKEFNNGEKCIKKPEKVINKPETVKNKNKKICLSNRSVENYEIIKNETSKAPALVKTAVRSLRSRSKSFMDHSPHASMTLKRERLHKESGFFKAIEENGSRKDDSENVSIDKEKVKVECVNMKDDKVDCSGGLKRRESRKGPGLKGLDHPRTPPRPPRHRNTPAISKAFSRITHTSQPSPPLPRTREKVTKPERFSETFNTRCVRTPLRKKASKLTLKHSAPCIVGKAVLTRTSSRLLFGKPLRGEVGKSTQLDDKRKQFFRSVNADEEEEEDDGSSSGSDTSQSNARKSKRTKLVPNKSLRSFTRGVVEGELRKGNKSMLEVMKLKYDVSKENMITQEAAKRGNESPLTRSAVKRSRR